MRPVDSFRLQILKQISSIGSIRSSWAIWKTVIDTHINPSSLINIGQEVFDLGEHISEVFRSASSAGRSQGSLSGGGAAWESLITWYLNMVFWGTNVIATRQNKSFVPDTIYKATSVSISNNQTNTESDIVVYKVPDNTEQNLSLAKIDELIKNNLDQSSLTIVQCKTNWNDNAQIPMLWDLIYNSNQFRIPNVSVGSHGFTPHSFNRFSYAFVTVPTSKPPRKPNAIAVLRVRNLTGGNYWGNPTQSGICNCINEFYTRNFPEVFSSGVVGHIQGNFQQSPKLLGQFLNLNFQ